MPEPTRVEVIADLSTMKKEFKAGTEEFNRWAQNIKAGNATAMKAFRETGEELRQLGKDARVSSEDMDRLNGIIQRVENAADRAGTRSANAFERGARGLSIMADQGRITERSLNSLIASGADLAFAFGPEGALISGVLMVTAAIVANIETTEQRMEDVTRKFNERVSDILLNDSPVEAARAAGRAYVAELQAIDKLKSDSARAASTGIDWGRPLADLRVHGFFGQGGSDQDAVMSSALDVDASRKGERVLSQVHAHDAEITQAKDDEKQARQELTQWHEKVTQLRDEGKTAELRVAMGERDRLQETVNGLRQHVHGLEQDRINTANRLAQDSSLTAAQRYALAHPDKPRELTDFSDEDRRSDAAASSAAAGRRIQQMERGNQRADELRRQDAAALQRANALLIQMEDSATQHEALSEGQREAAEKARARAAYDRRVSEIQTLQVTEAMKTQLLVAAARERDAAVAAMERTAYDRQQNALLKHMTDMLKVNDAAVKAQVRAEQEKERMLTNILASSGEALVRGHGDLAHRIMQAALEPEVKYLEAMAMKHYALAAKDAMTGNIVGAAQQTAGATALMAGAALLGSIAGAGGGGAGGSGGGGGGMSSASHMGASSSSGTQQTLIAHVIVEHQAEDGRVISRQRQQFQRLDDRNVSTRIGALA